jgi:hypothetical protein
MLPLTISFAALLCGLGLWSAHRWLRRRSSRPGDDVARVLEQPRTAPLAEAVQLDAVDMDKVAAANALLTERLWRLAFAVPSDMQELQPADIAVRERVCGVLGADRLDAKLFPRRPTLMPQLMRAMDDPRAAPERLSRIVAHDPVLAADVLRLANSSRFRTSAQPIETIQRAIIVLGVDALRCLLAMAMMQPVFRASRSNFPRFPRMLWERTERAARAAEAYAIQVQPADRFEAQLTILLSALGPLAVYGATLDVYAQSPRLVPNPALCAELTCGLAAQTALRIAHDWESSPRLAAAIEQSWHEPLARVLCIGELLGTVSLLQTQHVLEAEEALEIVNGADLSGELLEYVSPRAA